MSFHDVQYQFAACIRNPEAMAPAGVKPERMLVYQELFYNSIEGFISQCFPILKSLYTDLQWHLLVRDFLKNHHCHTPYFNEIGQEFLIFLQTERQLHIEDSPFLLELAHYEWIELALSICEEEPLKEDFDEQQVNVLSGCLVLSPLAWVLSYQFPVHKINVDYQPEVAPEQTTCLVVYRTEDFQVKYLEINELTFHCLNLLKEHPDWTGEQVLLQLSEAMQHPNPKVIIEGGQQIFQQLLSLGIFLGVRRA